MLTHYMKTKNKYQRLAVPQTFQALSTIIDITSFYIWKLSAFAYQISQPGISSTSRNKESLTLRQQTMSFIKNFDITT